MSVRGILILGCTAITIVLAAPTLLATSTLARLRDLAVEGRTGQVAAVAGVGSIQTGIAELDRLERSFIATYEPALGRLAQAQMDSITHAYERFRRSDYGSIGGRLGAHVYQLGALSREIDAQVRAREVEAATVLLTNMIAVLSDAEQQISLIAHSIDAIAREDLAEAEIRTAAAQKQVLAGLGIALVLSALLTALTSHAVTSPLRRLSRATARVAEGSFERPDDLPYERRDEIGELSSSFGTMVRRLSDLDRTKARFLGIVSHELKTPLNVICAYAELLREEWSGRSSTSARQLIADVAQQANLMSGRISRLMDLSRLETGAYRLSTETVLIEDLATGVRRTFERLAQDKEVRLLIRISDTAPPVAVLDVDIVRDEILGNLLVNAFRFSPVGGTVEVLIEGSETDVVFTVTDFGPGIPESQREHIFSKHYVEGRATTVGSGLGLAIAREMVELHGGSIYLQQTTPPLGARFRVVLPRGSELSAGTLADAEVGQLPAAASHGSPAAASAASAASAA